VNFSRAAFAIAAARSIGLPENAAATRRGGATA